MKRPNERQLNDRLRQAVSAISSNHAEELWNMPVEKADPDAWFLEETERKPKSAHPYLVWAGLAAACFAFLFLGWFRINRFTDAIVYLDVNPSITLDISRFGKVVSAKADNDDGRIILDNMNLQGTDVDVAMNAILGSMVKNGYLSHAQNTLLISVKGKNDGRTATLRQELSANAEQTLETLLGSGVVLGQTVDLDDAAEEIAEHYGITPGKAALIIRLLNDYPTWNVQNLAALPMADLIRHCQTAGIDISRYLGEDGEILGDLHSLLDDDEDDCGDDDHDDPDDDHEDNDHDDPDDDREDNDHDDRDQDSRDDDSDIDDHEYNDHDCDDDDSDGQDVDD